MSFGDLSIARSSGARKMGAHTAGLVLSIVTLLFAGLTGCGPTEGGGSDGCSEGSCTYGVCDTETGECVNANVCSSRSPSMAADAGVGSSGNASECLGGFACEGGVCQPETTCSDREPCDRGRCVDGGCTNERECSGESDCVHGFQCQDGHCVADACATIDCPRGICDNGQCVNRDSCPNASGDKPACVDGYACHDGKCVGEDEFCKKLDCQRGVCDLEQAACVNAEECSGKDPDSQCVEGYYCDESSKTCVENKCGKKRVVCGRGTCNPQRAECVNPDTCSDSKDCLPLYACVKDENGDGRCLEEGKKCGDNGCTGNLICEYDESNLTAECVENPAKGCGNALDCADNRICVDGSCTSPPSCSNDQFEGNDSKSNGTDYFSAVRGGAISATVCSGDSDFYTFDSSKDPDFRGQFRLTLDYEPADIGIGDLVVRVVQPDGSVWVEKKAGNDGSIVIDKQFGAGRSGVYHIEVADAGGVHKPGVRYTLSADIISFNVVNACKNATELKASTTTGNTLSGQSVALEASCVKDSDKAAEDVYFFKVQEKSFVQFDVEPTKANVDITAALRSKCEVAATEAACADKGRAGSTEKLTARLEPGTYYLIVQGAGAKSGGNYKITYSRQKASCTPNDNTCKDASTAKICGPNGQTMSEVACNLGCNQTIGACKRAKGDTCRTVVDATGGASQSVKWDDLEDDFNPGAGSCLPGNSPDSDGPDAVYKVDLKAKHAMTATLKGAANQEGSLYLLSACKDASSFCEKGTDTPNAEEELLYRNTSSSKETLFLVADSAGGTSGSSSLNIKVDKIICKPGEETCKGKDVKLCNGAGTGLTQKTACPFGCKNGGCLADKCTEAFDVTAGGTWSFDPTDYAGDYSVSYNSCVSGSMTGPDLVFKADVKPSHVLEAELDDKGSRLDGAIYIVTDCSSTSKHSSTCLAGADDNYGGKESVAAKNRTQTTQTYFIVVDTDYTGRTTNGKWSLTVKNQKPICTPGMTSCQGTALKYCDSQGLSYKTLTCPGPNAACATSGGRAQCNNPQGDICADAVPVTSGDTKTGDFNGTNTMELSSGTHGQCQVGTDSDESDTYYRIKLNKNDLLRVNLQTTYRYGQVYILTNCFTGNSCQKFERLSGGGEIYYQSPKSQVVYVVVDSYHTPTGTYSVSFNVTPNAQCIPNAKTCLNSSTVGLCNSIGSSYQWQFQCSGGCSNGACQFNAAKADKCSTAPNIKNGTVTTVDMNKMNNDVTLPSTGCTRDGSPGNDAVFQVAASAGQVIEVNAESQGRGDNPMIYIASGCTSVSSSCVAGSDTSPDGQPENLSYKVPQGQGGKYYVFLDAEASYDSVEKWDVDIRVLNPICKAGQILGCNGDYLQYCGSGGVTKKNYACAGSSSPKCQNGKCLKPSGDVCFDPITINGKLTHQGNFGGRNSVQLPTGSAGSCSVNSQTDGSDTIYKAQLSKGDQLVAELQTQYYYGQMYILKSCGDATSCQKFNAVRQGGSISYKAPKAETVYLVVDSYSTSSGTYTLKANSNAVCAPSSTTCVNSGTVRVCDDFGTTYRQFNCPAACTNGRCTVNSTSADKCSTAPNIGSGTAAILDMAKYTNDVNLPRTGCAGDDSPGGDAVLKVSANAGQTIDVRAETIGPQDNPMIYITSACSNPTSNCVAGSDSSPDSQPEYLSYKVPAGGGGTYYVHFDAEAGYDASEQWHVEVSVK